VISDNGFVFMGIKPKYGTDKKLEAKGQKCFEKSSFIHYIHYGRFYIEKQ
jgi:hypothetical protein